MDEFRFDTLAKLIGTRRSRRAAIGVAVAGLLGRIAVEEASAKRCVHAGATCRRAAKAKKKKGSKGSKGKKAKTVKAINCCSGTTCRTSSGQKVKAGKKGKCQCPNSQANCNGTCTPLSDLAVCPVNEFPRCKSRSDCLCTQTVEGKAYCAQSTTCSTPCTSSAQCPSGTSCVVTCCNGPGQASPHCLPSCGKI